MSVFKITDIKHPASADSNIIFYEDGTTSIPGLLVDDVALGDLSDVDTAGQQNETVLAFDAGQGKWRPAAVPTLVSGVPTGTITMFGSGTAPNGWLNCDGAAVSRTTFAGLFAVLGTAYGAGDGSTTFNLPDLRLKFPRGIGNGLPVGSTANANSHDHTVGGEHSHIVTTTIVSGNHAHTHSDGNYSGNAVAVGDHKHSTNTNQTGGGNTGGPTSTASRPSGNFFAASQTHLHSTPNHNHTINEGDSGGHGHNTNVSGNSGSASSATHNHNATANADTHTQDVTSSGSEHVPAYVAVNYIVKT